MPDPAKYYNTTTRWEPWQAKQQPRFVNVQTEMYPYPSVSDITFDGKDLIVGMRDIYSDTVPPNGIPQPGSLNLWGVAQGDLVRLCGTSSTNFVLESNRACPDGRKATGVTPNWDESFNGVKEYGPNNHYTFGPGGGEWFTGEDPWEFYSEGALLVSINLPQHKVTPLTILSLAEPLQHGLQEQDGSMQKQEHRKMETLFMMQTIQTLLFQKQVVLVTSNRFVMKHLYK